MLRLVCVALLMLLTTGSEVFAQQIAETVVHPIPPGTPTATITVRGRALDVDGKPIAGASVFLASHRRVHKLLKTTRTDKLGRYAFVDLELPLETKDLESFKRDRDGKGEFEVYAVADGFGIGWRPPKRYYLKPRGNVRLEPGPNEPSYFEADQKIELDIVLQPAAPLAGTVVDTDGKPIPKTKIQIWNCWPAPEVGAEEQAHKLGLRSIYSADYCPKSISTVTSNDRGEFRFPNAPALTRFRLSVTPPGHTKRSEEATTESVTAKGIERLRSPMRLVFSKPRKVDFKISGFIEKSHCKDTRVGAYSKFGSATGFADENGLASMQLPPGKFKVYILPKTGTPYLHDDSTEILVSNQAQQIVQLKMVPAAILDVQVIDQASRSGAGIAGFDFWIENEYPLENGEIHRQNDLHMFRSFDRKTRIAHVHREKTDQDGKMRIFLRPGVRRFGIGLMQKAEGWRQLNFDGKEMDLEASEPTTVTFEVQKKNLVGRKGG